ncbi:GNAT family N-acetyltransferase [Lentzea sp. NPDC051838]|uniref:GNAT family N-acetyltransferase n=1 Tax=Lentzea sp. NPDC051838 TaxID=3154849 RepID=UPI003446C719
MIIADWVWGWSLSRGTPDPVTVHDGYRIDVGLPHHRVRYVLPDPRDAGPRAAGLTEPGTWLKICGTPELDPRWTLGAPEFLMSVELTAQQPVIPQDPYVVEVFSAEKVHDVVVRTKSGEHAAKGRVAVRGHAAVVDMVETDPAHQRRGLGSVVMAELSRVAVESGAVRGVLVATEAGCTLYKKIGWAIESPITAAHLAA